MKGYLLRAVKLLCFILAVGICTGVLQEYVLCHADHNRERVKGFYCEDVDSLDVVYLGASEVYSDIAPATPIVATVSQAISSRHKQTPCSTIKVN